MSEENQDKILSRIYDEIQKAVTDRSFKKIVFSRPLDGETVKSTASLFEKGGDVYLQLETFRKDGKALHRNLKSDEDGAAVLFDMAVNHYRQTDVISADGVWGVIVSSKGKAHMVKTKSKTKDALETKGELPSHNRVKRYILSDESAQTFLITLGVVDKNGRVYDKKQSKYRQINKFLEQIEVIEEHLPSEGVLNICDLCCGKSYLTFAAYWYFSVYRKRRVEMYGVDLKRDVIAYCSQLSKALGYDIQFICGDVGKFTPPNKPNLVLSLHACDTATDHVLLAAVKNRADVILSTPCCHHEVNAQIKNDSLKFITKHSMLRQKLSDAVTDAVRAKILESEGYLVTVCELIDPEETPKNLLIRAVLDKKGISAQKRDEILGEIRAECEFFGITPSLARFTGVI